MRRTRPDQISGPISVDPRYSVGKNARTDCLNRNAFPHDQVDATGERAASFSVTAAVNTGNFLVGAHLFPVGVCTVLLGLDFLTGTFTLVPLALPDRRPGVTWQGLARSWRLVFVGNFAGAMTTARFTAITFTMGFTLEPNDVGQGPMSIGHSRTVGYAEAGAGGVLTPFVRAIM